MNGESPTSDRPRSDRSRPKRALITGITGQDGSYLTELLLEKGYEVHGIMRRASNFNTQRVDHLYNDPHLSHTRLHLHFGDLSDGSSLNTILRKVQPDEIYNLGAQSHVRVSFDVPEYTADVTGLGCVRLLEAVRDVGITPRIYQASSSELYGKVLEVPQSENTPFYPRSPYGAAKAYAFHITRNYREAYDMYAVNGILFNHESPRRGETFVSRKITRALSRIKYGLQDKLYLGNLEAKRDWGFAGDYVKAMWLMLQLEVPMDFVIATGQTHTVRDLLQIAADRVGIDYKAHLEIDTRYNRPTEVDLLIGDASKARAMLGWEPTVSFEQLIHMMVDSDMDLAAREHHALSAPGAANDPKRVSPALPRVA